jgi:hypothetical protein
VDTLSWLMLGYGALVALLALAFWLVVRHRARRSWQAWTRRQSATAWAWHRVFDRLYQRRLTHQPPTGE